MSEFKCYGAWSAKWFHLKTNVHLATYWHIRCTYTFLPNYIKPVSICVMYDQTHIMIYYFALFLWNIESYTVNTGMLLYINVYKYFGLIRMMRLTFFVYSPLRKKLKLFGINLLICNDDLLRVWITRIHNSGECMDCGNLYMFNQFNKI